MLNKVVLMGRLTADPELKYTPSNVAVCSFTLAVNRSFGKEETDFIDIVTWRSTAEFVSKYFAKGQQTAVCGRLQTRMWEDKNGSRHKAVEVVADEVFFADSKKNDGESGKAVLIEIDETELEEDGSLPF